MNFTLENSAILHIRGENGKGKTSLLKVLAGLLSPESGEILFNGIRVEEDKKRYQGDLHYLGHKLGLSLSLSIMENYLYDYHAYNYEKLIAVLNQFNLVAVKDLPCYQLSAGQKKRAALMRLKLEERPIWLLDEPFSSLDQHSIEFVIQLIQEHSNAGGMCALSSHIPLQGIFSNLNEFNL